MSYATQTPSNFVSSQEHRALLAQVTENDAFRAELQANPGAVLARFGIALDPSEIPAKVALPEKNFLASALDEASIERDGIIAWTGLIVA